MPNKDGTGPQGNGPKTGRGLGNCQRVKENNNNANFGQFKGRGQGCQKGQGLGQGKRCRRNN